jgi:predicted transcriptional regulator of viral defense system
VVALETLRVLKRLDAYPTFNVNAVANIIGKDATYTKVYLNRLKKRGVIQKLQRNVYTVQKDPLIIASRITWPSYISLWAAIRYHNLTEQIPNEISVVTTRAKNRRAISIMNSRIIFERVRPRYFFGFSKIKIGDFEVFMAEPEKALIDAVLLKRISVSEVYSMLKANLKNISPERITDYVLRASNKAMAKRFGWMLNSIGCKAAEKLKAMSYRTVIPLDYARPPSGKKDRKWGLIVNIGDTQ